MSGPNRQAQPCAVVGCKAVDWLAVKPRHRVPRDEPLRSVWLQRIGLRPSDTRKALFVCGRHFVSDDYFRNPQMVENMGFAARPVLRPQATPTLHLQSGAVSWRRCCYFILRSEDRCTRAVRAPDAVIWSCVSRLWTVVNICMFAVHIRVPPVHPAEQECYIGSQNWPKKGEQMHYGANTGNSCHGNQTTLARIAGQSA